LRLLAQALALIRGRNEVTDEDLEIIRHIAFSSIPQNRRLMLRALLLKKGDLSSKDAEQELRVSRPTARNWMKELAATGIAEFFPGDNNMPDSLTLSKQYSWLLGKKRGGDSGDRSLIRKPP
jgi:Fic family protein